MSIKEKLATLAKLAMELNRIMAEIQARAGLMRAGEV